jgi:hypothetical protein
VPGFKIESKLKGDWEEISTHLLSMDGVNDELSPLVKMTAPSKWSKRRLTDWPLDAELFVSTILLFGLIPVDLHRFKLIDVSDYGFREVSSSLTNKVWHHRRTIAAQGAYCLVRDEVAFVPRVASLAAVMKRVYKMVFGHRHKRLEAKYGAGG